MSGFSVSAEEKDPAAFALAIQELYSGRSNAAGSVTLAAGAISTVVQAINCAPQCAVFLFPKTANAAAAVGSTFVSSVGTGSFTLSHANNAQTDRSYFFVAIG
jgi:hypothetical protein